METHRYLNENINTIKSKSEIALVCVGNLKIVCVIYLIQYFLHIFLKSTSNAELMSVLV